MKAIIYIRPFLHQFLDEMKKYYKLVLFTASVKSYADQVLNIIDPKNEYFVHRLYRDSCIRANSEVKVKFILK